MADSVLGFVKDNDSGRLLLIRRQQPDEWSGLFNGVSGSIAEGETPVAAMARKLKEDGGLDLAEAALEERVQIKTPNGTVHVFRAFASIHGARQKKPGKTPFMLPHNNDWNREPVVPSLRWLLPLVFADDINGVCEVPTR